MKWFLRLFGVRTIEDLDGVRIVVPRYLGAGLPERIAEKLRRDKGDLVTVRVVDRSIIARYR